MEKLDLCQSCTMPLDSEALKGTEKDGSKSNEYCMYCYQNGAFVHPDMTFFEMEGVLKTQMGKMNLPPGLVQKSLDTLPHLKRWKGDPHLL